MVTKSSDYNNNISEQTHDTDDNYLADIEENKFLQGQSKKIF